MVSKEDREIEPDTPLRLKEAAAIFFRHNDMTVSGLRRERDRGNLHTFIIAGREMTTLAEMRKMVERCQSAQVQRVAKTRSAPACSGPLASATTTPSAARATLRKMLQSVPDKDPRKEPLRRA